MTAEQAASGHRLLSRLTGGDQAWLQQCRRVVATPVEEQIALLLDESGSWARALRAGRPLPDGDDLAPEPEIIDVRAACAIRDLALYLAGVGDEPAQAAAALLDHAEDAGLCSVAPGDLAPLLAGLSRTEAPPQLETLLRYLNGTGRPAAGYVALMACQLTGTMPPRRRASTVTALFDTADPAAPGAGAVGRITLSLLSHGPAGLHPDPAMMAFFYSPTPAFLDSLRNAWSSSPLAGSTAGVLWAITLRGHGAAGDPVEGPANTVDGGSLGGAFGAGLEELDRQIRWRVTPFGRLPVLRQIQFDLRRRIVDAGAAVSATVLDSEGRLGPVSAMDAKIEAAGRSRVHTVITHPDTRYTQPDHPVPAIKTARTVDNCVALLRGSRNPRFRRTVAGLTAAVLVIAAVLGLGAYGLRRAAREHQAALEIAAAERLIQKAVALRSERPRDALLLGEAAMALQPSGHSRASLTETVMQNRFAGTFADQGGVQALATDSSGQLVADATDVSHRLTLWRLGSAGRAQQLASQTVENAIRTIAFLPDDRTLVTGDIKNQLTLWDIGESGSLTRRSELPVPPPRHPVPLPPSKVLPAVQDIAVDRGRQLMAAVSSDGALNLWRLAPDGPHLLASREGASQGGWAVAFDPDRPIVVVGRGDGGLESWSIDDPQRPSRLGEVMSKPVTPVDADKRAIRGIAFLPGKSTMITASIDYTVRVWDLADPARPRQRQELHGDKTNPGHTDRVFHIAVTPDGRTAITTSADRTAMIWQVGDDGLLRQEAIIRGHSGYLRGFLLEPDGKHFLTGSIAPDGTITRWALKSPAEASPISLPIDPAQPGILHAIGVEPRRHLLAVGGADKLVRLYDIADPSAPQRLETLDGASKDITALSFSPDGAWLAASSWDGFIRLWRVGERGVDGDPLIIHVGAQVFSIAFSADGRFLAAGNEATDAVGAVQLWQLHGTDPPTLFSASEPVKDTAISVAFVDGDRIVASGNLAKTVSLWDATQTPRLSAMAQLSGHSEAVYDVRPDPRAGLLVSSSVDASSIVWSVADPRKARQVSAITAHTKAIRSAALDDGDGLLVSASEDGTLAVHTLADPANPEHLATLANPDGTAVFATARDSHLIAAATGSGHALLYRTDTLDATFADPLSAACAITGTGPDPDLWRAQVPEIPYRQVC